MSKTVAVIGAGMTGLAAAHHLHSHGCRPVVLEAGQALAAGQVPSSWF
ncbi:FAD-dependent oxidoreductase [Cutibacterium acnes]